MNFGSKEHPLLFICCLIIGLFCFEMSMSAQKMINENSNFFYQIAPLFDFKESVVSLTFDDGYPDHFNICLPLLQQNKLPGTFYIITKHIDEIKSLVSNKNLDFYEIGSHTVTHPDLVHIGLSAAKNELLNSQSNIQDHFGRNAGLTMSYPWGKFNKEIIKIVKEYYLGARATSEGYNSFYTLDRYCLNTKSFGKTIGTSRANSWIDYAIQNKLWLIEMYHGINNAGFSPIEISVFSEHLDYIIKNEDKIWCSTVSNVIKYMDESNNTKILCDFCNDTVFKIRINDFMDDSIFNQPLTISIKVPDNWNNIRISDNMEYTTNHFNENKFILFNALPDNQLITIRPGYISTQEKESGFRLVYRSANPFSDKIQLSLEVFNQEDIKIIFSDINGKILINKTEKNILGITNIYIDTSGLSPGFYFLKVGSLEDRAFIIRKMLKI